MGLFTQFALAGLLTGRVRDVTEGSIVESLAGRRAQVG